MEKLLEMEYVDGFAEDLSDIPVLTPTSMNTIANNGFHHNHPRHELVVFWTQSVHIFCKGTFIRSSGYTAFFCPAGIAHAQLNHPTGLYKRFYVQFPTDFLRTESIEQNLHDIFCCSLKSEQMENIRPYIDLLLKSDDAPEDKWKFNKQRYLLSLLFNELFCYVNKESESLIIKKEDNMIFNVCSYIHQHYQEKITLDTLADYSFTSRATLTKRFREVMGSSITDYILQVRIHYAIQYLNNGYSVYEAAEKCGFYDTAHFNKMCRKLNGKTPGAFKKQGMAGTGERIGMEE